MKAAYEVLVIMIIVCLGLAVVSCTSMNKGSDELHLTQPDCSVGVICKDESEVSCFDSENFYSPEKGLVCQRYVSE